MEEKTDAKAEDTSKDIKPKASSEKVAVILIRGLIGANFQVKDTAKMLRLNRKFVCTVWPKTPSIMGMLRKIKDYSTFGIISDDTMKLLIEKRGQEYKGRTSDSKEKYKYNRFIEIDGKRYKNFFRLSPPKGGFERKGIKKPFSTGGVLGDRKDKIAELINKMI